MSKNTQIKSEQRAHKSQQHEKKTLGKHQFNKSSNLVEKDKQQKIQKTINIDDEPIIAINQSNQSLVIKTVAPVLHELK